MINAGIGFARVGPSGYEAHADGCFSLLTIGSQILLNSRYQKPMLCHAVYTITTK